MKNILAFSLVLLSLIRGNCQTFKQAELKCSQALEIIQYAQSDFKEIIGELYLKNDNCNIYRCKKTYGIDNPIIQVCKEDRGLPNLQFDLLYGADEIQADVEFRNLERTLDECLSSYKKISHLSDEVEKRVIDYTKDKITLTIFQHQVPKKNRPDDLVTVLVTIDEFKSTEHH